jgi:alpha-tubulin suppressor-like RCC1 family protein
LCWGDNSKGQLGDSLADHGHKNRFSSDFSPTPVRVSGVSRATAVSLDESNSCALLSGGGVECWGDNAYGQLGNGSSWRHVKGQVTPPVNVKGLGS